MDTKFLHGALSGLHVLDMSRVRAGPWASQLMADLGADVVKVERPDREDNTHSCGPHWLKEHDTQPTGKSEYYLNANRNKRSLTIDFAQPEGQDLVRKLASEADILLENFKVGGLCQYGLDYATLKDISPRPIYCSITGFGQTGLYSQSAQAMTFSFKARVAPLARIR